MRKVELLIKTIKVKILIKINHQILHFIISDNLKQIKFDIFLSQKQIEFLNIDFYQRKDVALNESLFSLWYYLCIHLVGGKCLDFAESSKFD